MPEAKSGAIRPGDSASTSPGGGARDVRGRVKKIEMTSPRCLCRVRVCKGKRYNRETLRFSTRGNRSLTCSICGDGGRGFLQRDTGIERKLRTLFDVDWDTLRWDSSHHAERGEASGEALDGALKSGTGNTLYILDEPTTGLHFEDIRMLLSVLTSSSTRGTRSS